MTHKLEYVRKKMIRIKNLNPSNEKGFVIQFPLHRSFQQKSIWDFNFSIFFKLQVFEVKKIHKNHYWFESRTTEAEQISFPSTHHFLISFQLPLFNQLPASHLYPKMAKLGICDSISNRKIMNWELLDLNLNSNPEGFELCPFLLAGDDCKHAIS